VQKNDSHLWHTALHEFHPGPYAVPAPVLSPALHCEISADQCGACQLCACLRVSQRTVLIESGQQGGRACGVAMAIASRTPTPRVARAFMDKLGAGACGRRRALVAAVLLGACCAWRHACLF